FNVRVYGLLIHQQNLLLADESFAGKTFTKFPGGGLQFGESTVDCLKREFMEEYGWDVIVKQHFYTTDFFVPSVFDARQQVLAVYYFVEVNETLLSFNSLHALDGSGSLRWKSLNTLVIADVTFPIEKHVVHLLLQLNNRS
ncbi:MAG TPA: NUDIX domain-containing protein, partial [Bacteroidia bacterium]|nr:NUDIX domain-containing protein [Bacteroidia bacterium]